MQTHLHKVQQLSPAWVFSSVTVALDTLPIDQCFPNVWALVSHKGVA